MIEIESLEVATRDVDPVDGVCGHVEAVRGGGDGVARHPPLPVVVRSREGCDHLSRPPIELEAGGEPFRTRIGRGDETDLTVRVVDVRGVLELDDRLGGGKRIARIDEHEIPAPPSAVHPLEDVGEVDRRPRLRSIGHGDAVSANAFRITGDGRSDEEVGVQQPGHVVHPRADVVDGLAVHDDDDVLPADAVPRGRALGSEGRGHPVGIRRADARRRRPQRVLVPRVSARAEPEVDRRLGEPSGGTVGDPCRDPRDLLDDPLQHPTRPIRSPCTPSVVRDTGALCPCSRVG